MAEPRRVTAGTVALGGGAPLALIAGPCVIESDEHASMIAESLAKIAARCGVPLIFKASYDKANRTSLHSFRGPGIEEGLKVLAGIKRRLGVPILTDIHDANQAAPVAEVADVLQIPAFLSRQTDLLVAAARTGRTINIKKGQFLGHEACDRQGDRVGQRPGVRHRTGLQLRLPQPGRRHESVPDAAVARVPRRL
jgi:2-dehydro-3-deoxyphosphooctonate aldolase (KDO 8-P synthase)